MNLKQAYQALSEGKRVRSVHWDSESHVTFSEDGEKLIDEAGDEYSGLDHYDGPEFELFEQRNPHTEGTFAWARFEAEKKGKVVRRPFDSNYSAVTFKDPCAQFTLSDIDATDWRIVK